ncbi:hypothetical protein PAPYRUS_95 [Mycobacterium phage Papyrus]|uniref:Uncharacterized protein n=1 Tax=Mycobacterium phage Papyrus TaxID=1383056 RepID=S5YE63_9CAUD|nr:hypothetical protein N842_gp095 [Mycobacterium phage Papyrus]AGT14105.1 hypothetical protein PAPYRUS_95 [Mycobacterium phage Papyrus]
MKSVASQIDLLRCAKCGDIHLDNNACAMNMAARQQQAQEGNSSAT